MPGGGETDSVGIVLRVLLTYQRIMDAATEVLGWIAKWLVPACVAVGFVNVLLRYIGRAQNRQLASNRYVDMQWMLFGAIFLFAFPYILKHSVNVRVDFWFQTFSRKRKALIDFVGHIIALVPYCLFALWAVWDYAFTSLFQKCRPYSQGESSRWCTAKVWEVWEQSPNAKGLSPAPIKVLLLLGFCFLLFQTIAELIKLGLVLVEKEDLAEPEELPEAPLRIE